MLKFLQNTGLTDIRFIIINSQQTASDFNSLLELVKDSGIKVFQETFHEPIWRKLEGGKDDMFVYDRCGRLTYYVPYPLSGLHDVPIVHTTLLSSYFDYPCGKLCPTKSEQILGITTANNRSQLGSLLFNGQPNPLKVTNVSSSQSKDKTSINQTYFLNANVTKEIYDNQLLPNTNVYESKDGKKMVIDLGSSIGRQQKELIDDSDASGSGESSILLSKPITSDFQVTSSSSPFTPLTTVRPKVTINVITSIDSNDSLTTSASISAPLPGHSVASIEPFGVRSVWKIWQFFVGGTGNESGPVVLTPGNVTKSSTFSPNQSISSNLTSLSKTSSMSINIYGTNNTINGTYHNPNIANSSSLNHTTESWLLNGKRCNGFDKSVCVDISVSKLLRARLCCLNEVTGGLMGPGKGFRCTGYTKSICNKMFPLIKCCLKDFHHILGKYLNNNSSHTISSNIG